jgi:hypothetical protein
MKEGWTIRLLAAAVLELAGGASCGSIQGAYFVKFGDAGVVSIVY